MVPITYYHQLLGAAIIHPDVREVIPLMPEPIIKQDGTEKNDCERNAAKRFMTKLRQDHPHLKFIVTEDSLSSNAPHIETLHDAACHYILGVKEGDHTYLFNQVQAAEDAGRVTYYERHDRATGVVHRFRFVNAMPLNESRADVRVNFIEYWEITQDQVQHFSWVTDLRVSKRNVYKLMQGGRARWKIENETFNTLKNQGYNFEHNYGHGEKNLSVVFATLMMLAFLVDQTQQLCCALFQAVWVKLGSKRLLWERMRALFYDYALTSMRQLFEALLYGFKKSHPSLRQILLMRCLRPRQTLTRCLVRLPSKRWRAMPFQHPGCIRTRRPLRSMGRMRTNRRLTGAPRPAYGHSKDGRADLKQVLLSLGVSGDGGVPLRVGLRDGNCSDSVETPRAIEECLALGLDGVRGIVADSKAYSRRTLGLCLEHGIGLVTLVPRTCAIRQELEAWGCQPPPLPLLAEKPGRTRDEAPGAGVAKAYAVR